MAHNFSTTFYSSITHQAHHISEGSWQEVTYLKNNTRFASISIQSWTELALQRDAAVQAKRTQATQTIEPQTISTTVDRRSSADNLNANNLSADKLSAGLELLPQELYDCIFNLTFTAPSICRSKEQITRKDLHTLQVSHATRARLLPVFFAGGLKFDCGPSWKPFPERLPPWLRNFPKHLRIGVDHFECVMGYSMQILEHRGMAESHRQQEETAAIKSLLIAGFCVKEGGWHGCVQAIFLAD